MVKIAKTPKNQVKQKKMAPPPPKKVEESEEEESSDLEESSGEEMVPQKKQQKAAVTPAKKAATPAKKAATPAKKAVTPAKKAVATPAKKAVAPSPKKAAVIGKGAKNGKNAKKEESEEDDEDEEDEEEDEDEEDEEDDSEEEEEPAMPVKPAAKKPAAAVPAKKPAVVPAKQESEEEEDDEDDDEEDEESEDEAMDTTPIPVKKPTPAKAAPVKAKAESEDEEDDEEEDEDEEEEDDEEEDEDEEESEDEKPVKEAPGKRKKEMANKSAPEAKKKKTEKTEAPASAFSLFMKNLCPTKDYEELKTAIKEFFGKKNLQVSEVRIGSSKRFGYVDFLSAEDMDKALQLNGKKLMGLEIKLEKAKSKESLKENKKERDARTLFVKNLPYRLTEEEMKNVFENAVEVRIVLNKEGSSKGMAYVEFKTEAEADKALEEKQGTEIDGRAMVIDYTGEKSQQENQKGGGERESKTLIVNNLSYAASEETLQELFKKASSIKMPQNNQGRPKGYAFVEFPTAEDAKEALNSCNNTEIEGRAIRLEFSSPAWQKGNTNARGGFNQQSKTLFVRGLSEDTTEETLRESFEGSISARIVTDRDTGSSKGFGFVDFSSPEDAKAAKEAMEDGEIDGNKVTLDFAKPKGDFQRGGGFGGGFGGRGGGRGGRGGGRGGFGGRGGGRGFGGRGGGFRGGRGGGGDHKPQGKKIKFE